MARLKLKRSLTFVNADLLFFGIGKPSASVRLATKSYSVGQLDEPVLDERNSRADDEISLAQGIGYFQPVRNEPSIRTVISPHKFQLLQFLVRYP